MIPRLATGPVEPHQLSSDDLEWQSDGSSDAEPSEQEMKERNEIKFAEPPSDTWSPAVKVEAKMWFASVGQATGWGWKKTAVPLEATVPGALAGLEAL